MYVFAKARRLNATAIMFHLGVRGTVCTHSSKTHGKALLAKGPFSELARGCAGVSCMMCIVY